MGLSGQVSDSVVSPWHWWGPGQVLDLDLVPVPQVTEQEDQVPHSLKVPRMQNSTESKRKISINHVLKKCCPKSSELYFQTFICVHFQIFIPFLDSEFLLFESNKKLVLSHLNA